MPAVIRFDQAGLPAGIDNRARSDIVAGTAVNITNVSPGSTQNDIALLWKPPADDTAVIAGASPNWTIVPKAGTWGRYRVRLTVDGQVTTKTFTVRSPVLGLPVPAANEKADPTASLIKNTSTEIDAAESNEGYGPFPGGSAFGWNPDQQEVVEKLEDLFNPSTGHAHTGAGENGTPVDHDNLGNVTKDQHHLEDHVTRHQNGGADELNVGGLSGELADPQPPKDHALDPDSGPHTGTLPEAKSIFNDSTGHDHSSTGNKGSQVNRGNHIVFPLATGTYHNWSPAGLEKADIVNIVPIGGDVILTGIDGSKAPKEIGIGNGSDTYNVILKDNDSNSLAANRFQNSGVGVGDFTIRTQDFAVYWNLGAIGAPGWYMGHTRTIYNQGDAVWCRSSDGGAAAAAWHRLAIAASQLLGRTASSGLKALSASEVLTILGAIAGPASATDNAIVRYNGTTGKLVKNSAAELNDAGEIKIKVYSQGTEPALTADNFTALWINTSDSNRVYLIFRRGTSDQVKVELT